MSRYPRLIIGLAILAGAYWGLGGFDSPETVPEPGPDPVQSPDSTLESSTAMGGPDDGPHLGLAPVGAPGFPHPAILDRIGDWEEVTIGRNESFYVALQREGFSHETIMQVVSTAKPHVNLRRVRRGDTFNLARQGDNLEAVRFDIEIGRASCRERV